MTKTTHTNSAYNPDTPFKNSEMFDHVFGEFISGKDSFIETDFLTVPRTIRVLGTNYIAELLPDAEYIGNAGMLMGAKVGRAKIGVGFYPSWYLDAYSMPKMKGVDVVFLSREMRKMTAEVQQRDYGNNPLWLPKDQNHLFQYECEIFPSGHLLAYLHNFSLTHGV